MAHNFPPELVQKHFDALPDDIKAVLTAPEATQRLQNIGMDHKLRVDKIGLLIENTTLVSLGLLPTGEYIKRLKNQLEISQEQAENIAADIDKKFFDSMRDSLKQVQYQSTAEQRFDERDDQDLSYENDGYGGDDPLRESLISEIEQDANGAKSLAADLAGSDYSSADFNKASEYGKPKTRNKLDTFEQETTFGKQTERNIYEEVAQSRKQTAQEREDGLRTISPAFEEGYEASDATAAAVKAVEAGDETIKPVVPGFEKTTPAASAPQATPDASPIVTNFKDRLRTRMETGSHAVNVDPYKESIR